MSNGTSDNVSTPVQNSNDQIFSPACTPLKNGRTTPEKELEGGGGDNPSTCDIFSTSPVPPMFLVIGGGVGCSESSLIPSGLDSSTLLVSPRDHFWVSYFLFVMTRLCKFWYIVIEY